MGASSNAIASVLGEYWSAGVRAASWLGSELEQAGAAADAEAVVAVSQTGKSAEIYSALSRIERPRLLVTDVESSPIAGLAEATVPLALLEDSEVRTIGYTGTVQALLLLLDALAPSGGPATDWDAVADEVERLLPEAERLAERLLPGLAGVTAFDVVGSGVHAGTAAQGALLLREVCKLPASGYETYQYLHGPIEAAGPGRVLIAIGGAREAKLALSMADAGATVVLVTSLPDADAAFGLPALGPAAESVLGILPLQTITSALAIESGLPDGEFRYHQDDTKVG
jgi:glucosamine--fructose-6-phosphate aminotransferase (isomerizing)